VHYLSNDNTKELLDLKKQWGFEDPRNTAEYENCDVCANDIFRESWASAGAEQRAFAPPTSMPSPSSPSSTAPAANDQEALIQMITSRVMAELNK